MMDNEPHQGFDLDDSDLDLQAETYEKHIRIEDGLPNNLNMCDEKDKRIRELSLELYNEKQKCKRRCAAYEDQLNMILKDLEQHTEHISKKVADIVQSIKDIEEEQSEADSG
ncbi:hypothetical protein CFP56_005433 [Quercus suber]|uniref:Uncharacterized protein n=1 Tax=Quercus suber TaxID=58331 RepID=A0AAW0LAU2_QUESU